MWGTVMRGGGGDDCVGDSKLLCGGHLCGDTLMYGNADVWTLVATDVV